MKHDVKAFAFETSTADAEGAGALICFGGTTSSPAVCQKPMQNAPKFVVSARASLRAFGRGCFHSSTVREKARTSTQASQKPSKLWRSGATLAARAGLAKP